MWVTLAADSAIIKRDLLEVSSRRTCEGQINQELFSLHQWNVQSSTKIRAWLIKGTSDLSFYLSPKMIELLGRDRLYARSLWQRASEIEARGTSSPLQNNLEPARASDATCESNPPPAKPINNKHSHTFTVLHCTAAHSIALSASAALFTLGVPKVHGPNGLEAAGGNIPSHFLFLGILNAVFWIEKETINHRKINWKQILQIIWF